MRSNFIKLLVIIIIILSGRCSELSAQDIKLCPPSLSKKATKYLDEARAAKKAKKEYKEVKELLILATEEDTAFAEPWLVLGDAAHVKNDFVTMKNAYTRLIQLCPDADANAYYKLGTYLFESKKYVEAATYLKSYLQFATTDESKNKNAELLLYRAKLIANPVPFNPVLVKGVSTPD